MPPARVRNTVEDSKSDISSTLERHANIVAASANHEGRRNGNQTALSGSALKDVIIATQSTNGLADPNDEGPKVSLQGPVALW